MYLPTPLFNSFNYLILLSTGGKTIFLCCTTTAFENKIPVRNLFCVNINAARGDDVGVLDEKGSSRKS
jgi:hypothetical protein